MRIPYRQTVDHRPTCQVVGREVACSGPGPSSTVVAVDAEFTDSASSYQI